MNSPLHGKRYQHYTYAEKPRCTLRITIKVNNTYNHYQDKLYVYKMLTEIFLVDNAIKLGSRDIFFRDFFFGKTINQVCSYFK